MNVLVVGVPLAAAGALDRELPDGDGDGAAVREGLGVLVAADRSPLEPAGHGHCAH